MKVQLRAKPNSDFDDETLGILFANMLKQARLEIVFDEGDRERVENMDDGGVFWFTIEKGGAE